MDKQYAFAVVLIIIGLGLTQLEGTFYSGLGTGTVIIALVWIVLIIIRDLKRR